MFLRKNDPTWHKYVWLWCVRHFEKHVGIEFVIFLACNYFYIIYSGTGEFYTESICKIFHCGGEGASHIHCQIYLTNSWAIQAVILFHSNVNTWILEYMNKICSNVAPITPFISFIFHRFNSCNDQKLIIISCN